jgi:diacylglycerol kinase
MIYINTVYSMKLPRKFVKYNPFRSVKYAFFGIIEGFTRELNLVFQLAIGVMCFVGSLYFGLGEFAFVHLILMAITIAFEMMNTAFETLCDVVTLEFDERIKTVKDMAAGSVLICSLVWLCVIAVECVIIWQKIS